MSNPFDILALECPLLSTHCVDFVRCGRHPKTRQGLDVALRDGALAPAMPLGPINPEGLGQGARVAPDVLRRMTGSHGCCPYRQHGLPGVYGGKVRSKDRGGVFRYSSGGQGLHDLGDAEAPARSAKMANTRLKCCVVGCPIYLGGDCQRDPEDVEQGKESARADLHVLSAALQIVQGGSRDPAQFGQVLLAQSRSLPICPNDGTDGCHGQRSGSGHARRLGGRHVERQSWSASTRCHRVLRSADGPCDTPGPGPGSHRRDVHSPWREAQ